MAQERPSVYVGPESLWHLLGGALRLRPSVYREAALARDATRLCIAIAIVAGAARGIDVSARTGLAIAFGVLFGITLVLVNVVFDGLVVWSLARVFGWSVRFGEMFRPLALASAPALLYFVSAAQVSEAAASVGPVVAVWQLGALVVGIRAGLGGGWSWALGIAAGLWLVRLGVGTWATIP